MSSLASNPKFSNIQLKPTQTVNTPKNLAMSTPPRPRPRTQSGHFLSLMSPSSTSSPEESLAKEAIRIIRAKYLALMTKLFKQENLDPSTFYKIIIEAQTASKDVLKNVIKSQPVYGKYGAILEGYLKEDFFVEVSRLVQISTKIVDRCRNQYMSQLEAYLCQHPDGVDPAKLNDYDTQLQQSIGQELESELKEKVRFHEPSNFQCQCLQHYIEKYSNGVRKANQEKIIKKQPKKRVPPPPPPAELKPRFENLSNFPMEEKVHPTPPPKNFPLTSTILLPPPPNTYDSAIILNVNNLIPVSTGSVKCVAPNKPPRSPRSSYINQSGQPGVNSYINDQNVSIPTSAPSTISSARNFTSLSVSQWEHQGDPVQPMEKVRSGASPQTQIIDEPNSNVTLGKSNHKNKKSKKKNKESKVNTKKPSSVPKDELPNNGQLVLYTKKPSRKNCLIL